MKLPALQWPNIPRSAVVFSLKSFLAGMLALYIALGTGLDNPSWAVVTTYVVAQAHAGAVVSKAVYRTIGTFAGACASVLMVPPLVDSPQLLSVTIALWIGLCVALQMIDRTARGYAFGLAGFTSSIIIFPILTHPQDVFTFAASRCEEIGLGIVCASVVHATVFPVSTLKLMRSRLDAMLRDARAVCVDAFAVGDVARTGPDRHRLAVAINELHELLIHAGFEVSGADPRRQLTRSILAQVERLIPLSLAVADRIDEVARLGPLPQELTRLLQGAQQATADGAADTQPLLQRCEALRPALGATTHWQEVLLDNLLDRAAALIQLSGAIAHLHGQFDGAGWARTAGRRGERVAPRPMQRDWAGAAGAGLATALTVLASNALWIASGWEAGSGAPMMAGVFFAVYCNTPDPAQMLRAKFAGVALRLLLGAIYVVAVMPAMSAFGAMVLALAPALVASGIMMGMPRWSALGFNFVVGIMSPNVIDRSFHAELPVYLNAGIATLIGIYFAMSMVSLTRFWWLDGLVRRTLEAGRRDIARMRDVSADTQARSRSLMAHRLGLLAPRMAAAPDAGRGMLGAAARDMMVGAALAQLEAASTKSDGGLSVSARAVVRSVADHYRANRRSRSEPLQTPSSALREGIDACLALAAANADRAALLALTSLRRNLFPEDHSVPARMVAAGAA